MNTGFVLALLTIASVSLAGANPQADPRTGAYVQNRDYTVPGFERIYFSGAGTLRLTQGGELMVSAAAPREILDSLVIEAFDGMLFIDSPESLGEDLVIDLTVPTVREVVSEGAGIVMGESLKVTDLTLEGHGRGRFQLRQLEADELTVTGHDAANFMLSGQVNRQVLDLDGYGHYRAPNLESQSVEAKITGAGVIFLAVDDLLDIDLDGDARVRYAGSPFVSQRVSGQGSVTRVQEHSI